MATLPAIQQPELRAYPCYDRLPRGCVMFPVADDAAWPIFRPGEVVVIDPRQRDPIHGELFVIEYGKGSNDPRRGLVETFLRAGRYGKATPDGYSLAEFEETSCWHTGAYNRPRSAEEGMQWLRAGRRGSFVDGPVGQDARGLAYMRQRLVGRVIGILQPKFDETRLRKVN